ncbi:porin family protein [Marinoscillum sp. MHG1-6]|uniref:porin family protein n=1 Tax=Marinoscillum sp. MHG1-6 TaxID=2959627 RepID=UPI0021587F10|nr:porin family protein [Marinoscillum sp. MHG1-6]
MRKNVLLLLFLISASFLSQAQSKLGLKFSPVISSSRITLTDSTYDVNANGTRGTFSIGLIYDHQIAETYFFSTGLIFMPKRTHLQVRGENNPTSIPVGVNPNETYKLQYLQFPVTLKLYTNEIVPDGKIFFQVGSALEFLVNSEPSREDYDLVEDFTVFDFAVLLGTGYEYRVGVNTTLFFEVSYQRGLINQIKALRYDFQEELLIKSNIVALDFGIKF